MKTKIENSHIHLDIVGGIAGDMFISAMLDAFEFLRSDVFIAIEQVIPKHIGTPVLSEGLNLGISGYQFSLKLNDAGNVKAQEGDKVEKGSVEHSHLPVHHHNHEHDAGHTHIDAHHHDNHSHTHAHDSEGNHTDETTYKYLCTLIKSSDLKGEVANTAVDLLTIIATAEAKIHNKTLDDVHFHELADWDSLMDVVASAVILNELSLCTWSTSKLPLGSGMVNTQHGFIPVPAPATAEILLGFEFFDDNIKGERITPTGASILRYLRNHDLLQVAPQGKLAATGYGLGTKVFPGMPNILRAMHFDTHVTQTSQQDTVVVIEFDIDDMTGEELGLSLDLLRECEGVIDITVQTARGKKNRAVELIRIMASSQHYKSVINVCFIQTTTIGLRYRFETRSYLPRTHQQSRGNSFKSALRPNGEVTYKIEHDELTLIDTLHQRRGIKNDEELRLSKRKLLK